MSAVTCVVCCALAVHRDPLPLRTSARRRQDVLQGGDLVDPPYPPPPSPPAPCWGRLYTTFGASPHHIGAPIANVARRVMICLSTSRSRPCLSGCTRGTFLKTALTTGHACFTHQQQHWPSGVRRRIRRHLAAPPLPRSTPSGTPDGRGAALGSPGSVWARAVTATPAAGVEAVAGGIEAGIWKPSPVP